MLARAHGAERMLSASPAATPTTKDDFHRNLSVVGRKLESEYVRSVEDALQLRLRSIKARSSSSRHLRPLPRLRVMHRMLVVGEPPVSACSPLL